MTKAYDIMTRAVAAATPATPVSQVAAQMRDLNIGDVLIVENGKLQGIVTDRDLVIHALTNGSNATEMPVGKFMTSNVVTGQPDWSLDKIAQVMGENQIRRLPIVQNDEVVGIVSLGDLAVHSSKKMTVAQSLQQISETTRARFRTAKPAAKVLTLAIPVALTAAVLVLFNSKQGRQVTKQLQASGLTDKAMDVVQASGELPVKTREAIEAAREALQNPRTRRKAQRIARDARKRVNGYGAQLPTLTRRAPRKRFIFA
jgi:CBS domain-containing protein